MDHPLHRLLKLMTMRLLVVMVVLELKMVEVLSNKKWTQLPQITGLIAEEAPTKVSNEYVTLWTCSLWTWLPNSPSTLGSMIVLLSWSILTGSSDHLNYPLNNLTIAMLVTMASTVMIAKTVTIAMTSLTLLDKLGKV